MHRSTRQGGEQNTVPGPILSYNIINDTEGGGKTVALGL